MTDTLEAYYASGAPFIPPCSCTRAAGDLVAAIVVSVLFLVNFLWMWMQGKRPNPVKLALLVTSICFWWSCNNSVTNILAGIAFFEVFHDVQNLSIVWIYNRNRVEKDSSIGGFMRFISAEAVRLVGLYVGLVFAYGSLGIFKECRHGDDEAHPDRRGGGFRPAPLLLRWFIWKVRERSTRESLGLAGGPPTDRKIFPSWLLHGEVGRSVRDSVRRALDRPDSRPGADPASAPSGSWPTFRLGRCDAVIMLRQSKRSEGRLDEAAGTTPHWTALQSKR